MIRTILRGLNKVGGALVAAILYPIKSLIVNFLMAGVIFLLATLLLLGIPIIFVIAAYLATDSLFAAIIFGLVAGVIMLIVAPIFAAYGLIRLSFYTILDLARCFIFGVSNGFEQGLFFHVLNRSVFDFVIFSYVLQDTMSRFRVTFTPRNTEISPEELAELEAGDDIEANNDIPDNLVDVERSPQEIDSAQLEERNIEIRAPFSPLTPEEMQLAQGLTRIQDALDRYNSLYDRLGNWI